MDLSIKNSLLPLYLTQEADIFDEFKYYFYEEEDCIKMKIDLPAEAKCTLYKINNSNSKGVVVQIKNDLKYLETFYQLVNIEVHAVPSQEKGGVMFEIIETLERKPINTAIIKDSILCNSDYFFKTDKPVNFRDDLIPKLTSISGSPHKKVVRFFTKSSLNYPQYLWHIFTSALYKCWSD